MFLTYFPEGKPLTETEFTAIGATPERIELIDGSLLISAPPGLLHQEALAELYSTLHEPARAAGLHVRRRAELRLRPNRIPCCDLVIAAADATDVRLACEIVTPWTVVVDTVLKKHYYAAARIPWYMIVDPAGSTISLHRLDGAEYVLQTTARPGYVLELTDPVRATIDPVALGPRR